MEMGLMDLTDLANHIQDDTIDIDLKDLAAQLNYLDFERRVALIEAHYELKRPAPTMRVRVNVSTSVKGVVTTDSTLEYFGDCRDVMLDAVVELRKELSAKVDEAYPPPPLTS